MIHLIFIIHCHFSRAFCALDWVIYLFFIHSCQACICQTCTWLHFSLCGCGRGLQTGLLPAPVLLSLIGGFIAQRLLFVDCAVHHEHGSVLRLIFLMPADWEDIYSKTIFTDAHSAIWRECDRTSDSPGTGWSYRRDSWGQRHCMEQCVVCFFCLLMVAPTSDFCICIKNGNKLWTSQPFVACLHFICDQNLLFSFCIHPSLVAIILVWVV